ncbi:MAG: hypothetical protein GX051_05870 [Clostridiales bacterium]|nr:hypothetical protein [Clostridiales bacterium]
MKNKFLTVMAILSLAASAFVNFVSIADGGNEVLGAVLSAAYIIFTAVYLFESASRKINTAYIIFFVASIICGALIIVNINYGIQYGFAWIAINVFQAPYYGISALLSAPSLLYMLSLVLLPAACLAAALGARSRTH